MQLTLAALLTFLTLPLTLARAPKCSSTSGQNSGKETVAGCAWNIICNSGADASSNYIGAAGNIQSIEDCMTQCNVLQSEPDEPYCAGVDYNPSSQICNFYPKPIAATARMGLVYAAKRKKHC